MSEISNFHLVSPFKPGPIPACCSPFIFLDVIWTRADIGQKPTPGLFEKVSPPDPPLRHFHHVISPSKRNPGPDLRMFTGTWREHATPRKLLIGPRTNIRAASRSTLLWAKWSPLRSRMWAPPWIIPAPTFARWRWTTLCRWVVVYLLWLHQSNRVFQVNMLKKKNRYQVIDKVGKSWCVAHRSSGPRCCNALPGCSRCTFTIIYKTTGGFLRFSGSPSSVSPRVVFVIALNSVGSWWRATTEKKKF